MCGLMVVFYSKFVNPTIVLVDPVYHRIEYMQVYSCECELGKIHSTQLIDSWYSVFSPRIIQGMTGGHGLGVACGHIKALGLFPFPHQRKICAEGLQG